MVLTPTLRRGTVDIPEAAQLLGIGRATAYALAKAGEFPCPVLNAGRRYVVPIAALASALGMDEEQLREEVQRTRETR